MSKKVRRQYKLSLDGWLLNASYCYSCYFHNKLFHVFKSYSHLHIPLHTITLAQNPSTCTLHVDGKLPVTKHATYTVLSLGWHHNTAAPSFTADCLCFCWWQQCNMLQGHPDIKLNKIISGKPILIKCLVQGYNFKWHLIVLTMQFFTAEQHGGLRTPWNDLL